MADDLRAFVLEALKEFSIPFETDANGDLQARLTSEMASELGIEPDVLLTFDKERFQTSERSDIEFITPGSPVLSCLISRVRALGTTASALADYSEQDCQKFIDGLLAQYSVLNGQIVPSTLTISERYGVVFTALVRVEAIETREELFTVALDHLGQVIPEPLLKQFEPTLLEDAPRSWQQRDTLNVKELAAIALREGERVAVAREEEFRIKLESKKDAETAQLKKYFSTMRADLEGLLESVSSKEERTNIEHQIGTVETQLARRLKEAEERFSTKSSVKLIGTLLLRHKRVEGDLLLKCNSAESRTPINIPIGGDRVPQVKCQASGKFSRDLAFTEDGKLVDKSLIATCARSGKIYLKEQLRKCSVSGRLLAPEFIRQCPISLNDVEMDRLVKCAECQQLVSPSVVHAGMCNACRNPLPLAVTSPVIKTLLSKSPALSEWSKWYGTETRDVWTLQPSSFLKVGRLVVAKDSLKVVRYAKGGKLFGRMKDEELSPT